MDTVRGQIQWTVRARMENEKAAVPENPGMIGRSEQISLTNGVASTYACSNCCPNSTQNVWINPDAASVVLGAIATFTANETEINCFGQTFGPYEPWASWDSSNWNVASVGPDGFTTSVGIGFADISANWDIVIWFLWEDGYCEPWTTPSTQTAQVEVDPDISKIQYKGPNNTDFTDVTGNLYILKGTQVSFKAIPDPPTATFPAGSPTWSGTSGATGTGATISVTFGTVSSSTNDFKTVIATSGTSVTVNVVVYSLIGTLNAQDFFSGRSTIKYGLAEKINLGFLVSPGVTAQQMGGLIWSVTNGSGTISPGAEGSGTYTAPGFPSSETLSLAIVNGPSKGVVLTQTKTIIAPNGAVARQTPGTSIGHNFGNCSVSFSLEPYLLPTDVSFAELGFMEGSVAAEADGYYLSSKGDIHQIEGPAIIDSCDFNLGCKADFQDLVSTDNEITPCSSGSFTWAIPWKYIVGANTAGAVSFFTATHFTFNTPPDKVSIQKAGMGPFTKAISDPTTFTFP